MKLKTYGPLALVILVIVAGVGAFTYFHPHARPAKQGSPAKKAPGTPVSLIACAASAGKAQCLAVFKGACVVIGFKADASPGQATPVDNKYCGLK